MMKILIPMLLLLVTGCSNVPLVIKEAPKPDWQLNEVSQKITAHQGETVRWGGEIINVDNSDTGTKLQVVQFPLNSYGKPNSGKPSQGRFVASSNEFIDPYIYKPGTLVTIAGRVSESATVTVDKKTMTVPIVSIQTLYRWNPVQQYDRDPRWYGYPYYYDHFGYGLSYPHWRSRWYYGRGFYW